MGKNKLAAALAAALAVSVTAAGALEIVSAVPVKTEKGKIADFVFSGSVTVRGIAFENSAVVMPVTEYKDRTYTDIKILSKSLYKKIEACFLQAKCAAGAQAASPVVSLLGVAPLKSKTRIANVSLAFDGDLSVTFGAIKKASGEIWAAGPANFEAADEVLKNLIDTKVAESAKAPSDPDKKGGLSAPVKK
jgi:hypothetical protein